MSKARAPVIPDADDGDIRVEIGGLPTNFFCHVKTETRGIYLNDVSA